VSALGLIDLLVILPFYLPAVALDLRVLRVARTFRVTRLIRVGKLGRYSTALQTLGRVVVVKRAELLATGALLVVLLLIAATVMYYAENTAQPAEFSSIPAAMWWAVATLTTVGYGDVAPVTATGRLIGSVVANLGIGMFALPTGILGAAFMEEYQQSGGAKSRCPHCGR
jgi:voltage-gated potassium channel